MKVVIVGGTAGGASAAARLRRLNEKAQITVFERSGFVSYANCGLPYYIGGVIEDEEDLTVQTPQSLWNRFHIEVKTKHEVTNINRSKKTVTVKNLADGTVFEQAYDKLLLAPRAHPIKPNLSGLDNPNIYTLRTVEDTLQLRQKVLQDGVKSAVIIGGSFIGLETAENMQRAGLQVTVVERGDHILAPLDKDMAAFLQAHLRSKGVKLLLNTNAAGFQTCGSQLKVLLEDREPLSADLVLLAVGTAPESYLAKEAGLELGPRNSISVNEHMQTSDCDIYAVGDAVAITHSITKQKMVIALAGPANKQGRIAADNIAGLDSVYKGSPGSAVIQVFDMTAAFTGLNERAAQAAGVEYQKIILSPSSHASYYPGSSVMTVKLLYKTDTAEIIGAQIVGFDGVDKRLDVLATAMQSGVKAPDLKDLDLAYAPPYSSAKDPVNMAGFIAENVISGKVKLFFYEDLEELYQRNDVILLDTRTDMEYSRGFARGFERHIPLDSLRDRLQELDKTKKIYVMCQSGLRSYIACRILAQEGFDCFSFAGGYRFYQSVTKEQFNEKCHTDCGLK
ncbi:MAG: FAD-dependent oxidoreductase [Candidatus Bruticola sp.]